MTSSVHHPLSTYLAVQTNVFSSADLMHTPQQGDLVTGAVEPVVAQVDEDGGGRPGEGAVPGQVHLCTGRCRYLDMPRYAYRYI